MDSDDEMTGLNLTQTPKRDFSDFVPGCPNCGDTNYREIRLSERYKGGIYEKLVEHNICHGCRTRFNKDGEIINYNPALRIVLIISGALIALLVLIIIIGLISRYLK